MKRHLVWAVAWVLGCGDETPATDAEGRAMCETIAVRCHVQAAISQTAFDCNRFAEAYNTGLCRARQEECFAACPAVDAGMTDGALSTCTVLANRCPSSGAAMACHELGHAGNESACSAMYAQCAPSCGLDAGR